MKARRKMSENMKAIVYRRYGPPEVLELTEVPKPFPKDNQILINIKATTCHIGDVRMRIPDPFLARLVNGLVRPRKIPILGMELAGVVEAVGSSVRKFSPGDEVFAATGFGFGAYAEYICLPENGTISSGVVAMKPENLDFTQAAAVPNGGFTALTTLKKANIQPGQKALVYGASGSVGTYAVQIARKAGAEVTGVCSSRNFELVRSLGAVQVMDYTADDFKLPAGRYDLIFDAVGKLNRAQAKSALQKSGIYLNVMRDSGSGKEAGEKELIELREMIESGYLKPVIDRTYPLEEIVTAHRYVQQGHKRGHVGITV
jgi:NADPH:quinone reductase-like Zn-dependent oxidoreductase